jgi:hyperosmotically inducible protein
MKNSELAEHSFRKAFLAGAIAVGIGAGTALAASGEAAPQAKSDGVVAAISDTGITASVKNQLALEPGLKKSDISVTTTNKVVTLEGAVGDAKAKALAGKTAALVSGVKSVDNDIKVYENGMPPSKTAEAVDQTKRVVSDSWITTKVKSELLADSISKSFEISVKTTKGVVVLSGALKTQTAIDHVKSIAQKIKGVKSVDTAGLTVAAT